MDASVIMTTYNNPRALALTFEGYLHQSDNNFELVVADDGSGEETTRLVAEFAKRAPFPVIHAWHEHNGFRRAGVLNLGIRHSTTGYCIFTDGDCVPAADFIALHRAHRAEGCFLLGGYTRLTPEYSETLTAEKVRAQDFRGQMTDKWRRELRWRHYTSYFYNLAGIKDRPRIAGASFSAWRSDLDRVNGYNEDFVGWGREDSDIRTRFRRGGLRGRSLWNRCLVYHIWHPLDHTKANVQRNIEAYRESCRRVRCPNGLVKDA